MGRVCTICLDPNRAEIDRALANSEPTRQVASQFGVSRSALQRHSQSCLKPLLVQAKAERLEQAQSAVAEVVAAELDQVRDLRRRALDASSAALEESVFLLERLHNELAKTPESADPERTVALCERITRTARDASTLAQRVTDIERALTGDAKSPQSSDWTMVRGLILAALRPHPEAASAVVLALASFPEPDHA